MKLCRLFSALLFFILSLLFWACGPEQLQEESIADISPTIQVPVIRYEKDLMTIFSDGNQDVAALIEAKYPAFSEVFFHQVLALPQDEMIVEQELKRMLRDTGYIKLYQDVISDYSDMTELEVEISQALENYTETLQLKMVPKVYTYISGFAIQSFLFDDKDVEGVGIGLDMFLGTDFPYSLVDPTNPSFSSYLTRTYDKAHLTKKMIDVLVEDNIPPAMKPDFLSLMIRGGKKLYVMDQILDFKSDTILLEYTADQLKWCRENEPQMWEFFFDQNLFYEKDLRKFNKLISPAPGSPGMPPDAPGATANYIGWQIIKAYMARYPDTTIRELLEKTDAQEILDKSRFKPNRRN